MDPVYHPLHFLALLGFVEQHIPGPDPPFVVIPALIMINSLLVIPLAPYHFHARPTINLYLNVAQKKRETNARDPTLVFAQ